MIQLLVGTRSHRVYLPLQKTLCGCAQYAMHLNKIRTWLDAIHVTNGIIFDVLALMRHPQGDGNGTVLNARPENDVEVDQVFYLHKTAVSSSVL